MQQLHASTMSTELHCTYVHYHALQPIEQREQYLHRVNTRSVWKEIGWWICVGRIERSHAWMPHHGHWALSIRLHRKVATPAIGACKRRWRDILLHISCLDEV